MLRKCKAVLVVLLAYILLYTSAAAASAKIKVPFASWNFGEIPKGKALSHDFEIYNAGKSVLAISNINTSCGCTAVVLISDSIAPGEMGTIHVKFDSSFIKAGKIEKYITIYSNALRKPRLRLTVSGVVVGLPVPKIRIKDQIKDLGMFFPKQSKTFNVTVGNDGKTPLHLKKLTSQKYVSARSKLAKTILKPGEKKQLPFTLAPPVKSGAFSMLFGIPSNDPVRPEEYVRLKGYVTEQKAVMIYQNNGDMLLVNGLGSSVSVQSNGEKEKLLKNGEELRISGKSAKVTLPR